jgi:alkylated DNA repair dioxygenase AlkB
MQSDCFIGPYQSPKFSSSMILAPAVVALSPAAGRTIARGGVHVEQNWLPPELTDALLQDALHLCEEGMFINDGLADPSRSDNDDFSLADRRTLKNEGWASDIGDAKARRELEECMKNLRCQLAVTLARPSLASNGAKMHEMTYNVYEPGASLGLHLDEHHEDTKGPLAWSAPTRRSITWLLYLNVAWDASEGGSLRCFPRESEATHPVGCHDGNLQVGWLHGSRPVFRSSKGLYCHTEDSDGGGSGGGGGGSSREVLGTFTSAAPRARPANFLQALVPAPAAAQPPAGPQLRLSCPRGSFEQISSAGEQEPAHHVDIMPVASTLVVFDSVSMPHLVQRVTASRRRLAVTGWFHEDSTRPLPTDVG